MTRGITCVVFGKSFEKMAAATIKYSRKFTDLPFCVLTDIPQSDLLKNWSNIKNIEIITVENKENRDVKTQLSSYTPFDQTMYVDCDAVVQNPGLDEAFETLETADITLLERKNIASGKKIWRLYRDSMARNSVTPPAKMYYGGILLFNKGSSTDVFFSFWNQFWKNDGKLREMPALLCAAKHSRDVGIRIAHLERRFFAGGSMNNEAVIQHDCSGFREKFGIPKWHVDRKMNRKRDWDLVDL